MKKVLQKVFDGGNCVYETKSVEDAREHFKNELNTLWDETKRLVNPHRMYVDLSRKLWDLKQNLLINK